MSFPFSTSSNISYIFLMIVILMRMICYYIAILICVSMVIRETVVGFLFHVLAVCVSFEKYPFRFLAHFLIGLFLWYMAF